MASSSRYFDDDDGRSGVMAECRTVSSTSLAEQRWATTPPLLSTAAAAAPPPQEEKESTTTSTDPSLSPKEEEEEPQQATAAAAARRRWQERSPDREVLMRRIRLVQQTWRAVELGWQVQATQLFYQRLWEQYPAVLPLFHAASAQQHNNNSSTTSESSSTQAGRLYQILHVAVSQLDPHYMDELIVVLQDLGRRHVAYGAQPAHYRAVIQVFLQVWRECVLGQPPDAASGGPPQEAKKDYKEEEAEAAENARVNSSPGMFASSTNSLMMMLWTVDVMDAWSYVLTWMAQTMAEAAAEATNSPLPGEYYFHQLPSS